MSAPLTREQIAKVDRFYTLTCAKQAWDPQEKELNSLRAEILGWYENLPAEETASVKGTFCELQIGQRSIEKCWTSWNAVQKAVGGWSKLREICSVSFNAVADLIGNSAAEALQSESRTGHRRLKAVPLVTVPCERKAA